MMEEPIDYNGSWKMRRYQWKKAVMHCQHLSGGAKLLATYICEQYANAQTACCFPSNDTLASALGFNVRTVQRHLGALKRGAWMKQVRMNNRRRALQLVFPPYIEHDSEHDIERVRPVTSVSRKHDSRVAPYKEPKNNLRNNHGRRAFRLTIITVGEQEAPSLEAWRVWISRKMIQSPDEVMRAVRSGSGYQLPCRFPDEELETAKSYLDYLEWALTRMQGSGDDD